MFLPDYKDIIDENESAAESFCFISGAEFDRPRRLLENLSPVFFISMALLIATLVLTLLVPDLAKSLFVGGRRWSVVNLDWFFIISANAVLLLCFILAISPIGKRRFGDELPRYSYFSWYAMIIMTGVGLTLVFWGIAEPAAFYTDWWGVPLNVEPKTAAAAELALSASLYHWGLHPWAIYSLTALMVAYACYNKGQPFKLSAIFYPVIKPQNHIATHLIDTLAVLATVFGVATTMGLGVRQAGNALEYLYGIPNTLMNQSLLLVATSIVLMFVLQKGLSKGIKGFNLTNFMLVLVFAFTLVAVADFKGVISILTNTSVSYVVNFAEFSQWYDRTDLKFFHGWTVFYWIWWFSWAPFIGIFIAKISAGRSIRECILAIVLIPSLFSLFWFSVSGGVGLEQISQGIDSIITPRLSPSTAVFKMLESLPLSQWLSLMAISLVLLCFVSTSNASIYVLEVLTRKGGEKRSRVLTQFWVLVQGGLALMLLIFGGKKALESVQSASLLIGVVMCLSLVLASFCFMYNLKQDRQ